MVLAAPSSSKRFLGGITLGGCLRTCLRDILDAIRISFFASFAAILSDSLQITRF